MSNDDHDMVTTEDFLARLETFNKGIEDRLEVSAKERHAVNGAITKTLFGLINKIDTLTDKTENQDIVLGKLKDIQQATVTSIDQLKSRLIGDGLGSIGMSADIATNKLQIAALDIRVNHVEDGMKWYKKIFVWTVAVFATVGTIITWIKASGIVDFLMTSKQK